MWIATHIGLIEPLLLDADSGLELLDHIDQLDGVSSIRFDLLLRQKLMQTDGPLRDGQQLAGQTFGIALLNLSSVLQKLC